jgi:uncharacterized iron-regulated membrane protein
MKLNLLNRKIHYWLSLFVALPLLVIVGTGIILQWKKHVPWIQPTEQKAGPGEPRLSLAQMIEIARTVPEAGIQSWSDLSRVDIRPGRNLVKLVSHTRWEIQLDARNGAILQAAYRRSDLIEEIHDGTFFHDRAKLWLFFPAALGLLALILTGLWLFLQPFLRRSAAGAP